MQPDKFSDDTLATDRRWSFWTLVAFLWSLGAVFMAARVSAHGWTLAAAALFGLFLVLQAQLVYGFTLAVTGWWLLRNGGDPVRIGQSSAEPREPSTSNLQPPTSSANPVLPGNARRSGAGVPCARESFPGEAPPDRWPHTAIIMPIFNEDVGRVFRGLRVMYESLRATGQGAPFDFFILSDSADLNTWIAEEKAWFDLCKQVQGFGRIFYRKRRLTLHHKSGNVADFCRRWGAGYKYLIVLDADSIMTGPMFVRLAGLMEQHPQAGIIQTHSRPVLGRSLFQRIQQFASIAYGRLFVAGANFWQLDNANFYGHNAIIRVQPFMQFCGMPELPPVGRLGTQILSHDTVEAALIRRAGYEVWSDYDLEGSYEESPPDLAASLQRDRRWCRGNMQHLWFLFSPGLTWPSRVNILVGILAYLSSPLWLLFLLLSPVLFTGGQARASGFLFVCAMVFLLAPKLLGASSLFKLAKTVGGRLKILASVAAETVYSMLLAPILMLCYTEFVWSAFFGMSAGWGQQKRGGDGSPSWRDCAAAHLMHTVLAVGAGVLVALVVPAMLPWLALVLIGPAVAIPFARLSASTKLGLRARRRGWFLIPEETQPPWELRALREPFETAMPPGGQAGDYGEDRGLAEAILDPRLNALHVSLLRERPAVPSFRRQRLEGLCDQLLQNGPAALPPREKRILLWDADSMLALHQKLWSSRAPHLHEWWQAAFWQFRDSLAQNDLAG
jgi:membrane glycosyltransferase